MKFSVITIVLLALLAPSCSVFRKDYAAAPHLNNGGYFPVLKGGVWGFIDKTGNLVIKPQFDAVLLDLDACPAADFTEGLNVIMVGGKFGYVDKTGRIAINPRFEVASPFSEGLAMVTENGKSGFIDKAGQFTIRPEWDGKVYQETEHAAAYGVPGKYFEWNHSLGFSEGWAPVTRDGRANFVNPQGHTLWSVTDAYSIDTAERFSNGLAFLSKENRQKKFFTNTQGKAPLSYLGQYQDKGNEYANTFSEGLFVIQDQSSKTMGYIDTSGNVIIPPQFEDAENFSEGLACVGVGKYPDKKFGFIDHSGKFVINPQFKACGFYAGLGGFSDGLAVVKLNETNDKAVYINKKGEIVIRPDAERICKFSNGVAAVVRNNQIGYIDMDGRLVWPFSN